MGLVRGTALTNFHQLVTELGGDSRALTATARIAYDDIGRHDRFISVPNAVRMLEDAAEALQTPDFGRRLAVRQGLEILGPVGLAGRNAATVADAFLIFDKFMAAYSPSISIRLTTHLDPDLLRFELEYLLEPPPPPQAQAIEQALGVSLQVMRLFLGTAYRPVAVHLPHTARTNDDDYRRYFGCKPTFSATVAGFTVRTADVQRPLPRDNLAHQTAVDFLTRTVGDHGPAASQQVSTLVRQLLPTGTVNLKNIARHIGLHPETLQRRLAVENTTFAGLVDQVRRDSAQRLLLDTDLSLDHLCRQLGYAEQSVLTRSCKRWFGTTPTSYRTAHTVR